MPTAETPNNVIAPFWGDLLNEAGPDINADGTPLGGIWYEQQGSAPNRRLIVTWVNSTFFDDDDGTAHVRFQAILDESGAITFQYVSATDAGAHFSTGAEATIGLENSTGTQATAFSFDEPVVSYPSALTLTCP
jgi:hypothetical protein